MEPRLTETLKYFFLAMLLILASQGVAQSLPKTTDTEVHATIVPNTESQETIANNAELTAAFNQAGLDLLSTEDIAMFSDEVLDKTYEEYTYFKVRSVVRRTKFAEELVVRKSYLA